MSDDRVGGGTKRDKIIITIVGLLAAPVVGGIAGMTCLAVFGMLAYGAPFAWNLSALQGLVTLLINGAIAGFIYGAAPAFVAGWPVHAMLVTAGFNGGFHYIICGGFIALIGVLILVSLLVGPIAVEYFFAFPTAVLSLAIAGAVGGFVFWLIRRPDKDQPKLIATPPVN